MWPDSRPDLRRRDLQRIGVIVGLLLRQTCGQAESDMMDSVMAAQDMATALVMGCILIAVGLFPGLLSGLMSALNEGIERFRNSLAPFSPRHLPLRLPSRETQRLTGQRWFAVAGVLLIALGLYRYLAA